MDSNFNIYNDDCLDRLDKIKADSMFIGIEKGAEYCKIAEARIKYAEGGNDVKGA
jgi:DNA modification methylase